MIWLVLAILTAFFESLKDVFSKRGFNTLNEYVVAWASMAFSLPFLLPLLFLLPRPTLGHQFWLVLLVEGGLNVVATLLYIKAIKHSDLSVTIPMVTFTPLFLLITSPIMVRETPTLLDGVGIALLVLGSYLLNLKTKHRGFLAPFRAFSTERGPKLMLLVALIWSVTSNFDKIGVQNSSPTVWAIALYGAIAAGILPIMLYKSSHVGRQIATHLPTLIPIGLFGALVILCQMQALTLTLVTHVIAVKRTSALMSVVWGCLLFGEKNIKTRLFGASIMVLGVAVMTLV